MSSDLQEHVSKGLDFVNPHRKYVIFVRLAALLLASLRVARAALLASLHVRRLGVGLAAVGDAAIERGSAARRLIGRHPKLLVLVRVVPAADHDGEHHERAKCAEPALRSRHYRIQSFTA